MKICVISVKSVIYSVAAVFLVALFGCAVPYPHTNIRSLGVAGRIVDAKTGFPIAGARIQPLDYLRRSNSVPVIMPDLTTTPVSVSDVNGRFKLPRSSNMLWTKTILAPCYSGVTEGEHYYYCIVTKAGYVPVQISPEFLDRDTNHLKESVFSVGDIPLSAGDSLVPENWLQTRK